MPEQPIPYEHWSRPPRQPVVPTDEAAFERARAQALGEIDNLKAAQYIATQAYEKAITPDSGKPDLSRGHKSIIKYLHENPVVVAPSFEVLRNRFENIDDFAEEIRKIEETTREDYGKFMIALPLEVMQKCPNFLALQEMPLAATEHIANTLRAHLPEDKDIFADEVLTAEGKAGQAASDDTALEKYPLDERVASRFLFFAQIASDIEKAKQSIRRAKRDSSDGIKKQEVA